MSDAAKAPRKGGKSGKNKLAGRMLRQPDEAFAAQDEAARARHLTWSEWARRRLGQGIESVGCRLLCWLLFVGSLSLLLTGCGASRIDLNAPVHVSTEFTADEQATILEGVQRWHEATGGMVDLAVTISDDQLGDILYLHVGNNAGLEGLTDLREGSMSLDRAGIADAVAVEGGTYEQTLLDTTMHEFGHAFGLGHVPGTLMRAVGFGGAQVDAVTLRLFKEQYQ